jgi:urease accessory protein
MLLTEIICQLDTVEIGNRTVDYLQLEWFETTKRIIRKKTQAGIEVSLKFLQPTRALTEGDVLYTDDKLVIAVAVNACDCLVICPGSLFEMAAICYEIGNKHLPLFYQNNQLLVPADAPLQRLLTAQGYTVMQQKTKLLSPLNTTVKPHTDTSNSLFNKIMKLTN